MMHQPVPEFDAVDKLILTLELITERDHPVFDLEFKWEEALEVLHDLKVLKGYTGGHPRRNY